MLWPLQEIPPRPGIIRDERDGEGHGGVQVAARDPSGGVDHHLGSGARSVQVRK